MELGENIKKLRQYCGLTQRELAERCGFHTGTIQQYELGKREPNSARITSIAAALGLPVDCVLSGITPEEAEYYYQDGIRDPSVVKIALNFDYDKHFAFVAYKELTAGLSEDDLEKLKTFADFLRSRHSSDDLQGKE